MWVFMLLLCCLLPQGEVARLGGLGWALSQGQEQKKVKHPAALGPGHGEPSHYTQHGHGLQQQQGESSNGSLIQPGHGQIPACDMYSLQHAVLSLSPPLP